MAFNFHRRRSSSFGLALGFLLWWAASTRAGDAATEYSIKAAFLYNFAQFVQWPTGTYASPTDTIVLGVLGEGDFPPDLRAINGRTVPGHGQNRVITLKRLAGAQDASHCQILFVLRSAQPLLRDIMREVAARSVLTVVEDADDLAQTGAVVNLFKTRDNRIRFEINVDAAKRAELKIDSPLLNLAKMVREHS